MAQAQEQQTNSSHSHEHWQPGYNKEKDERRRSESERRRREKKTTSKRQNEATDKLLCQFSSCCCSCCCFFWFSSSAVSFTSTRLVHFVLPLLIIRRNKIEPHPLFLAFFIIIIIILMPIMIKWDDPHTHTHREIRSYIHIRWMRVRYRLTGQAAVRCKNPSP